MNELVNILGEPNKYATASLGGKYAIWNMSHRKAVNKLLKNGFTRCPNPAYIQKNECTVRYSPLQYKQYFVVEA